MLGLHSKWLISDHTYKLLLTLPKDGVKAEHLTQVCSAKTERNLSYKYDKLITPTAENRMILIKLSVKVKYFHLQMGLFRVSGLGRWSGGFPEEGWRARGDVTCWALWQRITYWGLHVITVSCNNNLCMHCLWHILARFSYLLKLYLVYRCRQKGNQTDEWWKFKPVES